MKNKNYPHPVIRFESENALNDDYKSTACFDVEISQRVDNLNYHFNCEFHLKDSNLELLLAEEKVAFAVKIACSTTRFRQVFSFNDFSGYFSLPAGKLERIVTLESFIVSKTTIENFYSENFSEDYEGEKFKVFSGDILAEGPHFSFDIDKKNDSLAKIPSIFTIIQGSKKTNPDVVIQEEKIVIVLNKDDFNHYKNLKSLHNQYSYLAALSSTLFILPAMVMIIEDLKKEIEKLDNDRQSYDELIEQKEYSYRWFKVINANLKNIGIDLFENTDSSLSIAQQILGDPLSTGLNAFDEIFQRS